jgi:hypothetical protein
VPETVAIRSQSVDYFDALIDARYPGLGNTLLERLNAVPGWTSAICRIFPLVELLAARCPPALSEDRRDGEICPVLGLSNVVERLCEVVPYKTSRYLRRARRRAASIGDVTVTRAEISTAKHVWASSSDSTNAVGSAQAGGVSAPIPW